MPAAVHNFFIEQGSDFEITFQYLDSNQNPVDLSNYCVSLLWKPLDIGFPQGFSSSLSTVVPGTTPATAWTLKKDNLGNITFNLSYIFTKNIQWTDALYDLYITDSATPPKKYRIATGQITTIKDNFPECATSSAGYCSDCTNLAFNATPPTPTVTNTLTGSTPTVTTSTGGGPTVTPTPLPEIDLCATICNELDMYAVMYSGAGMILVDNGAVSGTIDVANTGIIQNIEVMINRLKHQSPQDLVLLLTPPTGNTILLSAHNKISNNSSNGFSCIFSNKAASNVYLNNALNNSYVNILDKTSIYKYNNLNLSNNLQSWIGSQASGSWTLSVIDDDTGVSGTIDGWHLIVTYEPPPLTIDEI